MKKYDEVEEIRFETLTIGSAEEDNGEKYKTEEAGVIFVLENAPLDVTMVGKTYQLINPHDNGLSGIRSIHDYRPELTHQALLMIMESPLNKSGKLKSIYVRTFKDILFEVKPNACIPKSYKRFAGLMVQLFLKHRITVGGKPEVILRMINNPVTSHLPVNSRIIEVECGSENLVKKPHQYLSSICKDTDTVFVIDGMEHHYARTKRDYMGDVVTISKYRLDAAICVSRICEAISNAEELNEATADGRIPRVAFPNPGVIFVIEKASLEVDRVGKAYELLNSIDHAHFLRTSNRNPADYRPDITHQALLSILESPVNKAGRLKAVYVRTERNVIFEVKPHASLPRVYRRFAVVMMELLQLLVVSEAGCEKLKVINSPVTDHLPVKCRKIGLSLSPDNNLINKPQEYLANVCNETDTVVFVVGAMGHGNMECEYLDDLVAISEYPLSTPYCISRVCEALSRLWNIT